MLRIIVDKDWCYPGRSDIRVGDSQSYVESRLLLDELKAGYRQELILLISPVYSIYYEDLQNIPGWSHWIDYTLKELLAECGIALSPDDEAFLFNLELEKQEIAQFILQYNINNDLKENLLSFLFWQGHNISTFPDKREAIIWLEQCIENNQVNWVETGKRKLLIDSLPVVARSSLLVYLLDANDMNHFQIMVKSVIGGFLFNDYSRSDQATIRARINFYWDEGFDRELIEYLINQYPLFLEEINHLIASIKDSLSLFESERLGTFLRQSKGFLNEEWNWVWNLVIEELEKSLDITRELQSIKAWSGIERKQIDTLLKALELVGYIKSEPLPETFDEWVEFYCAGYLKYFPGLERKNNVLQALHELNNNNEKILNSVIKMIEDYNTNVELHYQSFLLDNYPELLVKNNTNLRVPHEVKAYAAENKVFYWVIDGLRWELWEIIRRLMESNGYFLENKEEACVTMIPSVTSISRLAVIAGQNYASLLNQKENGIYPFAIFDEAKQAQRFYEPYKLAFKNGDIGDIDALLTEDAQLYIFVYSQTDSIFHVAGDVTVQVMEALLANIVNKLVEKLKKYDDLVLVIATDHGSIKVKNKPQLNFVTDQNLEVEQIANSIVLFADQYDETLMSEVKLNSNLDLWNVIWREQSAKYGLPSRDYRGKEVYAWMFPRAPYYVGKKSGSYTHGALSMQETIIPYGFFRKAVVDYDNLMIELGSYELLMMENSYLDFFIFNPNVFSLKEIKINMQKTGADAVIYDIAPKHRRKVRIYFLLKESYCEGTQFDDVLTVQVNYLQNNREQLFNISAEAKLPKAKAINREMAAKRTLDF